MIARSRSVLAALALAATVAVLGMHAIGVAEHAHAQSDITLASHQHAKGHPHAPGGPEASCSSHDHECVATVQRGLDVTASRGMLAAEAIDPRERAASSPVASERATGPPDLHALSVSRT